MLAGVGLVATVAASIAAYFVGTQEDEALTEVNERLMRIEAALTRLSAQREDQPHGPGDLAQAD